jgi:hypothetical protein
MIYFLQTLIAFELEGEFFGIPIRNKIGTENQHLPSSSVSINIANQYSMEYCREENYNLKTSFPAKTSIGGSITRDESSYQQYYYYPTSMIEVY